jgi:hypothetical protein
MGSIWGENESFSKSASFKSQDMEKQYNTDWSGVR